MARSNNPQMMSKALVLACLLAAVAGQGLPVQYGLLPTGDLTTVDQDGPYDVPDVQAFEVRHLADRSDTRQCLPAARSGVCPVMMLVSSWQRLLVRALTTRFLLHPCLSHRHHALLIMTPHRSQVRQAASSCRFSRAAAPDGAPCSNARMHRHSMRAPCRHMLQPACLPAPSLAFNLPTSTFLHAAALAAKTGTPGGPFTDFDVLNFLANTECLEATFNTYAAFGAGMPESLMPGPVNGTK